MKSQFSTSRGNLSYIESLAKGLVLALLAGFVAILPTSIEAAHASGAGCSPFTGRGTVAEPYLVSTTNQFLSISDCAVSAPAVFELINDINLGPTITPLGAFEGVLDGGDHTINFGELSPGANPANIGLFTTLSGNVTFQNLQVDGSINAGSKDFVGLLAGYAEGDVTLANVSLRSNDSEARNYAGLAVGFIDGELSVDVLGISGELWGDDFVGGVAGYVTGPGLSVSDLRSEDLSVRGDSRVGAVAGAFGGVPNARADFMDVDLYGFEVAVTENGSALGGLVGLMSGSASVSGVLLEAGRFYAENREGNQDQGGLFGRIEGSGRVDVRNLRYVDLGFRLTGNGGLIAGNVDGPDLDVVSVSATSISVEANFFGDSSDFNQGTGGLFGLVDNVMTTISNVAIQDLRISGLANIGGIVGMTQGALHLSNASISSTSAIAEECCVSTLVGSVVGLLVASDISLSSNIARSTTTSPLVMYSPRAYAGVGGLAGYNDGGIDATRIYVQNSEYSAAADDRSSVGLLSGAVGINSPAITLSNVLIRHSSVTHPGDYLGGLGAFAYDASLRDIQMEHITISSATDASFVGGLFGNIFGMTATTTLERVALSNFTFVGIDETEEVAGLIGEQGATFSAVQSYFAIGVAPASQVIDVIYDPLHYSVSSTFILGSTSTRQVGSHPNNQLPTLALGISEASFSEPASFVGWDFQNTWGYVCGNPYPQLRSLVSSLVDTCSSPQSPAPSAPPIAQGNSGAITSAPYRGPLPSGTVEKNVSSGDILKILGSRLGMVVSVEVDGVGLAIQSVTDAELIVRIPNGITSGPKNILIRSSEGSLEFLNAFNVVAKVQDPSSSLTVSETVSPGAIMIESHVGKTVVTFSGYEGSTVAVRIGGVWATQSKISARHQLSRPTRAGRVVTVKVFVNRLLVLERRVRTT